MWFNPLSHRSRSRRTGRGLSATHTASPARTRRAERRQAIRRAGIEVLEDRRLLSFTPAMNCAP